MVGGNVGQPSAAAQLGGGAHHDERHQIGGMGCMGLAIFVEHFFGVAVIGCDHGDAAHFRLWRGRLRPRRYPLFPRL